MTSYRDYEDLEDEEDCEEEDVDDGYDGSDDYAPSWDGIPPQHASWLDLREVRIHCRKVDMRKRIFELQTYPRGAPVKAQEKLLLLAIVEFYNEHEEYAWPSVRRLAQYCGLSKRQTQRLITKVNIEGLLGVEPRWHHPSGRQTSNEYYLTCHIDPDGKINYAGTARY